MILQYTEYPAVFLTGAAGYSLIEIVWRGYTHWSMALTGGICFLFLYIIERGYITEPLWKKCAAGSLFITVCELVVGFVVNILLGWAVWDYSDLTFNIAGQICPLYTVLWFFLCFPVSLVCTGLRHLYSRQSGVSTAASTR